MTFPKLELLCSMCNEPMDIINQPELKDNVVEYKFQCKANERPHHRDGWSKFVWCVNSRNKIIQTLRIIVPISSIDDEIERLEKEFIKEE